MLLRLPRVVSDATALKLREMVLSEPLTDGRHSAFGPAAAVKNNLELGGESPVGKAAGRVLLDEITKHPIFHAATVPAAATAPRFSLYLPGMFYGRHLDGALMTSAAGQQMRSDIAVTVFLCDPTSFVGGELVIEMEAGREVVKGDPGDCIIYPATQFHRIEPVRDGQRAVAFFWIQSLVRSSEQRRILFDLVSAIEKIDQEGDAHGVSLMLRRCHLNLLRHFAEP